MESLKPWTNYPFKVIIPLTGVGFLGGETYWWVEVTAVIGVSFARALPHPSFPTSRLKQLFTYNQKLRYDGSFKLWALFSLHVTMLIQIIILYQGMAGEFRVFMVCMYVNLKNAVLLFNLRIQILTIKIQINFIHLYMQRSSLCEGVLSRFMSCFQSLMTQPFEVPNRGSQWWGSHIVKNPKTLKS